MEGKTKKKLANCGRSTTEFSDLPPALMGRIYQFVRRRVPKPEDAEDIAQETFLRLVMHQNSITGDVVSWLYRTAFHLIADYYRQAARQTHTSVASMEQLPVWEQKDLQEFRREVAMCLRPLLILLSPADREAITSIDLQGMSQRDFAAQKGLSHGAARSRVQRARKRLREELQRCCVVAVDSRGSPVEWECC